MWVYNTLTKKQEILKSANGRRITFFVCGPTVYDRIHLGNARTFVFFDAAVKYLRTAGYSVFYLQNITDIDDKIIKKALDSGTSVEQVASQNFERYVEDLHTVHVDSVSYYAFATDFIKEIKKQIRSLMRKKVAYLSNDGLYFRVSSFADYGALSGQLIEKNRAMARHEMSAIKEKPEDFVIWKFSKKGEPSWDSPWGKGRPGWHIEDTAIAQSFLGDTYDIHGAGSDLIFPHHEGEIAIMRSITNKKRLSRYWLHTGMLNLGQDKMAKSTGNIISLHDAVKIYSPETVRLFLLNANYRSELIFSKASMHEADQNRQKIQILYDRLLDLTGKQGKKEIDIDSWKRKLKVGPEKDFDFRTTISVLLDLVAETNRLFNDLSEKSAKQVASLIYDTDRYLCILRSRDSSLEVNLLMAKIMEFREVIRSKKNYELSDILRTKLSEAGISVEDSGGAPVWRKK